MTVATTKVVAYLHQWFDLDNLGQNRANVTPIPAIMFIFGDATNVIIGRDNLPGIDPTLPLRVKNVEFGVAAGNVIDVSDLNNTMSVSEFQALSAMP